MKYYELYVLNGNFDDGFTVAEIQKDYDFDADDSAGGLYVIENL